MIQRKKGNYPPKRTKGGRACAAGHPLNDMKAVYLRLITALFNPFHSLRTVVKRPQCQLGTFGSGKRLTAFQKEITAFFYCWRNARTSHKGNYRSMTSTGNTGYFGRTCGAGTARLSGNLYLWPRLPLRPPVLPGCRYPGKWRYHPPC